MEVKKEAWSKFLNTMDFESETSNFKIKFSELTKKYGNAYIVFCRAMWESNDGIMSEDEFMVINGEMPRAFFDKNVRMKEIAKT